MEEHNVNIPDLSGKTTAELKAMLAREELRLARLSSPAPSPQQAPQQAPQQQTPQQTPQFIPQPQTAGGKKKRSKQPKTRQPMKKGLKIALIAAGAILGLALIVCVAIGLTHSEGSWSGQGYYTLAQGGDMSRAQFRQLDQVVQERVQIADPTLERDDLKLELTDGAAYTWGRHGVVSEAFTLLIMKPGRVEVLDAGGKLLADNSDISIVEQVSGSSAELQNTRFGSGWSVAVAFNKSAQTAIAAALEQGSVTVKVDGEPLVEYKRGDWSPGQSLIVIPRLADNQLSGVAAACIQKELPFELSSHVLVGRDDSWAGHILPEPGSDAAAQAQQTPAGAETADDPYDDLAPGEYVFEGSLPQDIVYVGADDFSVEDYSWSDCVMRFVYNTDSKTVRDLQVTFSDFSLELSQPIDGGTRNIKTSGAELTQTFPGELGVVEDDLATLSLGDEGFLALTPLQGCAFGVVYFVYSNETNSYQASFAADAVVFYNVTDPSLLTHEEEAVVEALTHAALV